MEVGHGSHSNKPAHWVFARYFGKFNKARQDRWVFGDRHSGAYLHRFAWTNIVRHQIVKHRASPDDPELADYWAWRRRKAPLPINRTAFRLHQEPGRALRDLQDHANRRLRTGHKPHAMGALAGHHPQDDRRRLGHSHARTRLHPVSSTSTATTPASHQGLLEPDARKRARPVLRGARRRKAPGLPDEGNRPPGASSDECTGDPACVGRWRRRSSARPR